MGRKIFVSYKYKDSDVQELSMPGIIQPTWVSDYVEYIKKHILASEDIYKGENQDEANSSRNRDYYMFFGT